MLDYNILRDRIYKFLGHSVGVELTTCKHDNSAKIILRDLTYTDGCKLKRLIDKTEYKMGLIHDSLTDNNSAIICCRNDADIVTILDIAMNKNEKGTIKDLNVSWKELNQRLAFNYNEGFKELVIKKDRNDYTMPFEKWSDRIDKIYVDEKKKTIAVKWKDGDVTKVKLRKGDKFDIETGAALAILKKVTFPHHHLQKVIEKNLVFVEHKKGKK